MADVRWYERVLRTLLRLSRAFLFDEAIVEWKFTGESKAHHRADQVCELCGQKNLRYRFKILNEFNGNVLNVGSNCIKRFPGIEVRDEDDQLIFDPEKRKSYLDRMVRKLRGKAKKAEFAYGNGAAEGRYEAGKDFSGWMDIHQMEYRPPMYE